MKKEVKKMKITLMYPIIANYRYDIILEDYFNKEEYGKSWEELTTEEKNKFLFNLGYELHEEAEKESPTWNLGEMEYWLES